MSTGRLTRMSNTFRHLQHTLRSRLFFFLVFIFGVIYYTPFLYESYAELIPCPKGKSFCIVIMLKAGVFISFVSHENQRYYCKGG